MKKAILFKSFFAGYMFYSVILHAGVVSEAKQRADQIGSYSLFVYSIPVRGNLYSPSCVFVFLIVNNVMFLYFPSDLPVQEFPDFIYSFFGFSSADLIDSS